MAQFPSLPLWTDAYLADTGHLTDAEHGVYLQLLMMMWRTPECRLPNDKTWLSRRFRRPIENIEKDVMPIVSEFCVQDGNWITQRRLKKEWEFLKRRSKAQSDRAKSRWAKDKHTSPSNAEDKTPAMPPHPHPSLPLIESKENIKKKNSPRKNTPMPEDWALNEKMISYATKNGMEKTTMDFEFRACKNHHEKVGRLFKVWNAVWQTWVDEWVRRGKNATLESVSRGMGYGP